MIYAFDLPEILDELKKGDPWFSSSTNVTLVPGSLPVTLSNWLTAHNQLIDFALVDATHDFNSVYSELSLVASRLSSYGYIVCHDYGRPASKYEGVMCAVNEAAHQNQLSVLPFWSAEDAEGGRFCQAAILRRQVKLSKRRRLFYWRRYYAKQYPLLAKLWGRIRYLVHGD
jgi:hypothetical protein